jgi:fatty acid synthase subunit beta
MGEPIHIIANRGGQLWAELDKTVFSLDRKKRGAVIAAKKNYIISRLNADFQRPWFGTNAQREPCDITDMTYSEVMQRIVELMFAGERWTDQSYTSFLFDFLLRIEARFSESPSSVSDLDQCVSYPSRTISNMLQAFPRASMAQLYSEDADFFMQLCRRPGAKPVPFVPSLDDNFETYFKKDSLWQSKNLDTVVDQDAGRVFIQHGPVAARYTAKVNEPVGEVLDFINTTVYQHILAQDFEGNETKIPYEEFLQRNISPATPTHTEQSDITSLSGHEFRAMLSGAKASRRTALFCSRFIVQGQDLVRNYIGQLLDTVKIDEVNIKEDSVSLFSKVGNEKKVLLVKITRIVNDIQVALYTYFTGTGAPVLYFSISSTIRKQASPQFEKSWKVETNGSTTCTVSCGRADQGQSMQAPRRPEKIW